jgi:very-short-patch-repair endonuclease
MRGAQPWRTNRARILREHQTTAEGKLWSRLRNRQLGGFKFVRQAPVDVYFADFLCRECLTIVEIDGATHWTDSQLSSDHERDEVAARLGYRVLRFSNDDVNRNIEGVLDQILAVLEAKS